MDGGVPGYEFSESFRAFFTFRLCRSARSGICPMLLPDREGGNGKKGGYAREQMATFQKDW